MKKILIFSLAYYPRFVSGAEAALREITDRIPDIEFHMVTLRFDPNDSREERIGNVIVHRVGNGTSYLGKVIFPFGAANAARKLHIVHHFDALWAMMTYMLIPVAMLRIMGMRIPYALTLQDGDPYEKVFGRARIVPFIPLINHGFRHATVIQAISSYLAAWPERRGYRGHVEIIYNGANPKDLKEQVSPEVVQSLRERLGKQPHEIYIGNTARLVHQKGFDTTLRALPSLPPHIKFLIVGGGEEEEKLRALAHELAVDDRVIFTGHVDRTEVTAYRKVMDIFVGPSRSEGLGNAFLSAMASRIPVVATQEGGIAEFLFDATRNPNHETTGWAVTKDRPEEIVRAVHEILQDPERTRSVTDAARRMVEERFDWDAIALAMRARVFGKL